ncbi:hypothetical protein FHS18_000699 [Paenibacillus phyllosphaerae]|uniref:Aminoglycoside phosphotransferase domain-containing protein n=1 Tax=Paenibacillus phyllosphaerae TaxID=274593 RepID=A0A7W5FL05_9BACL|nr:phosphotransferase [Paenibacillus phyllosphaerae]MBB3108671.1 hypothetical protein [Paenibacillus phyllosphaerae]
MTRKLDFQQATIIYAGLGERKVERVMDETGGSFIVKPSSHPSREAMVYEQVLPAISARYPKLLSQWEEESSGWLLFEDLGELEHPYDLEAASQVMTEMARWHELPPAIMSGIAGEGVKPSYADMVAELRRDEARLADLLGGQDSGVDLRRLLAEIGSRTIDTDQVISHGDLHVGNYSLIGGQLYILDWEHAHLSCRYWDLFHVIDLSHPLYPRRTALAWREELLQTYWEEAQRLGAKLDREAFLQAYGQFAIIFSLWMLKLIAQDLSGDGGPWAREQLLVQQAETLAITLQLFEQYGSWI